MRHAYHNTTELPGQIACVFETANAKKDSEVLAFFERHKDRTFTPIAAHAAIQAEKRKEGKGCMLLTSVRRAMNNLQSAGFLYRYPKEYQVTEVYGRPNYIYQHHEGKRINQIQ